MSEPDAREAPRWMGHALRAAAVYNIAWGALVIARPGLFFAWIGIAPPRYPEIWQCVGMIVGVYGVGYWLAARAPFRHWPIVLVGLLGKVLGPIGFVRAVATGALPAGFGWTILVNDLVWWFPFGAILFAAADHHIRAADAERPAPALADALASHRLPDGTSLDAASRAGPLLIVFLRHFGCCFCREALADVAAARAELEAEGVRPVLVHSATPAEARPHLERYRLADVPAVPDPDRRLYRAFGLERGGLARHFHPRGVVRAIRAALRGHRIGAPAGDGFQLPGVFRVENGRITRAYRHARSSDRPDYARIACAP